MDIKDLDNTVFLKSVIIPPPKVFITLVSRDTGSLSGMVFRVTFTLYPKSGTIGIIVAFSRQSSSTKWTDRFANPPEFFKDAIAYHLNNTLLSIVDMFSSCPLSISGNTAVVAGDENTLLSIFEIPDTE